MKTNMLKLILFTGIIVFLIPQTTLSQTIIKISENGHPYLYNLQAPIPKISGDGLNLVYFDYLKGGYSIQFNNISINKHALPYWPTLSIEITSAGDLSLFNDCCGLSLYKFSNDIWNGFSMISVPCDQSAWPITCSNSYNIAKLDDNGNIYYSKDVLLWCDNPSDNPFCCVDCASDPFMMGCWECSWELHVFKNNVDLGPGGLGGVSKDGSKIVYTYNGQIWVQDDDGSNKQALVQGSYPVISPDGGKVIFKCLDGTVCLINTDGTNFKKIASLPGYLTCNMDATRIITHYYDGQDYELVMYEQATDSSTLITDNNWNDMYPDLDNHGKTMTFISNQEGVYHTYLWLDTGDTPQGNNLKVDTGWRVVMIYPHVFLDGRTRMEVDDQGPELPPGFTPGSPQTYYHLSTTAGYEGEILLCITYDENAYGGEERVLHLLHSHGLPGDWEDITVILDTEQNQICGLTSDLSDFTIAKGPEWPPYEPPPPSGPFLSSTDDDDSSCGSLPGSLGGGLGAGILLLTCLMALRRLRKTWSKK